MKRILITGANSYIGMSFERWMSQYSHNYVIDTLDMRDPSWQDKDLSLYDVVFHVAGIAHADVSKVSDKTKQLYYDVNTNLTIQTAEKYKRDLKGKTGQFIYMSSIIIYGKETKINKKPNTVRVYSVYYNAHIRDSIIGKKNIDDINEADIQLEVINKMLNLSLGGNTIKGIKRILKPLFEENDKILNWKKIELPLPPKPRKYYRSKEDTVKIVKALNSYYHPVARGVFKFLLTGRRVNEILYLEHENIDYKNMKFKILAKYAKTNKDFEFPLTQVLIDAIKEQKTSHGRIFKLEHRMILEHFKSAMSEIGIYDMVVHDIRSMVAQTALDNGASIYDVSKMLAHQKVATTEHSYVEGGLTQAKKAQEVFEKVLMTYKEDIEDVEIIEDKFNVIKGLYPNVGDEVINYVISILESKIIK